MTTSRPLRACAALVLALPLVCSAAVVSVRQTIDLNTLDISGYTLFEQFDAPLTLAVGDVLHLSYDFAGDQTLRMVNPTLIAGWVGAADWGCTNYQATGSLDFVNARGPVRPVTKTETSGCLQFGLDFSAREFMSTRTGTIEFSGLDFIMSVDAYDNRSSRDYTGPLLYLRASRFAIGREGVVDIPEPASLGLMGLGALALAAGRRRRAA